MGCVRESGWMATDRPGRERWEGEGKEMKENEREWKRRDGKQGRTGRESVIQVGRHVVLSL